MDLKQKTIEDFGTQFTWFRTSPGYYGSLDLFNDIISPLIDIEDLRDKKVADIGSGTGRIVSMLLDAAVCHITSVEPSSAFFVLKENLRNSHGTITFLNESGDKLPPTRDLDYVFSIGVIHHIPEPAPVLNAVYSALKPGGKFFMWVYGKENNEMYLKLLRILRYFSAKLSHDTMVKLSTLLLFVLKGYISLCKRIPLPLRDYLVNTLDKCSNEVIRCTIYDQLKPAYSKYYTREDAILLMERAHFKNVKVFHRHGYSWSVIGEK